MEAVYVSLESISNRNYSYSIWLLHIFLPQSTPRWQDYCLREYQWSNGANRTRHHPEWFIRHANYRLTCFFLKHFVFDINASQICHFIIIISHISFEILYIYIYIFLSLSLAAFLVHVRRRHDFHNVYQVRVSLITLGENCHYGICKPFLDNIGLQIGPFQLDKSWKPCISWQLFHVTFFHRTKYINNTA